jgi:hypothetical protein
MRRLDLVECGLLHATRGRCGLFSVVGRCPFIENQRIGSRLSEPTSYSQALHAELATSQSPYGPSRAE